MKKLIAIVSVLILSHASKSHAIMESGDWPWGVHLRDAWEGGSGYYEKYPSAWFLTLGPTGIKARIYPSNPKWLVVKFVYPDNESPARGLIEIEDVIVGANGKKFTTAHKFGRKNVSGWDGPLMELAGHIEDSQGKDGKLSLIVRPKGQEGKEKNVTIQLRVVGRFSDTYPYNCKRSEQLLTELCDFLVLDYEAGVWKKPNSFYGQITGVSHQMLAFMASGEKKYLRYYKAHIQHLAKKRYSPEGGGYATWAWGYDGILMGEYYHLYKDKSLIPAMKSLAETMPYGSWNRGGIVSHRSYLNIKRHGGKPYASIALISGLHMLAMSLFKSADLYYDEPFYSTLHKLYLNSATPQSVQVGYGFNRFDQHAVIHLTDKSKGLSGKGPGYPLPTGIKDIGEYTIIWPTKADHRWKPTDWVAKEASTSILEEMKSGNLTVYRADPNLPKYSEPTKRYRTSQAFNRGAVGLGALAHIVGNKDNESWNYLGYHAANSCALGPGSSFDGHAASHVHAFWTVLGAARSDDPKVLRKYLDYMKTFLILSESHNKRGMVLQPWGRDRPGKNSDLKMGPRILPTSTAAILLSLGKRRLLITGAGLDKPASRSGSGGKTVAASQPKPQVRQARTMSAENSAALDRGLLGSLVKLSEAKLLRPMPIPLSVTRSRVSLTKVAADGTLTFSAGPGKNADIDWKTLKLTDHVNLAILITKLKPDSHDGFALAGVYLERVGRMAEADRFFAKAGPESRKKLVALFE